MRSAYKITSLGESKPTAPVDRLGGDAAGGRLLRALALVLSFGGVQRHQQPRWGCKCVRKEVDGEVGMAAMVVPYDLSLTVYFPHTVHL